MNTSQHRPRPGTLARSMLAIGLLVAAALVATPTAPASAAPLANHVVGWGSNGFCCPYQYLGQATPPAGLTDVVAISAREYTSLALLGDGTVVGWGLDENGQATPPAGLTGVVAISLGMNHSLALRGDGTVVGWGYNGQGEATPPAGLTDAVAIAGGDNFSLALRGDGTVVGWGYDVRGTPPAGLTDVVAIAAGSFHSLALRGDGTVVGWGYNGDGTASPPPPAGLTDVVAIAAGFDFSLALRGDGTVVGWGDNSQGQATPAAGLTDVTAIAAGRRFGLALRSNGTVVAWGANGAETVTPPQGLTGVTAIAAGEGHGLAVVRDRDSLALDVWAGPAMKRTLVYSQRAATLTSGDYVIKPATGNVTSVTGTGTISGLDGSRVTFHVTYNPATRKYAGAVDIAGAGFDAHIRVRAGRFGVTRNGDMVKGTLYGIRELSNPKRCFVIVFRIKDLG